MLHSGLNSAQVRTPKQRSSAKPMREQAWTQGIPVSDPSFSKPMVPAPRQAIRKKLPQIQICFGGQDDDDAPLYVGSVKTVTGHLEADQLQAYSNHLKAYSDINVSHLARTLHSRRSQLPTKTAFSAATIDELTSKIHNKLAEVKQNPDTNIGIRSSSKPAIPGVLGVFTGQGSQWAAMGEYLIRSSDFVRRRLQDLEGSLAALPPSDRPQWHFVNEMLASGDNSRILEAELSAVVGHSSGEIAASYAAGSISAQDAIRIAYHRGLYTCQAGEPSSEQRSAILAVGSSWEDAQDLVNLRAFRGRLAIAAHNSSASVTFSGDADATILAKKVFDEEKKSARILKVDTAYHSHHMLPCSNPYISSLRACGVGVNREKDRTFCSWFSSVVPSNKDMDSGEELQGTYWRDNMTDPVLFVDAVKNAVASDQQLSLALKVGPYPVLQGLVMQNISECRSAALPYYVFPAAGYVAIALEAARSLAGDRVVELFELHDLTISKAITFKENVNAGVETLVTLTAVTSSGHQDQYSQHPSTSTSITADISCYSCPVTTTETKMELVASGCVKIVFGTPIVAALASIPLDVSKISSVDADRFYSSLHKVGYGYKGTFRGISSLKRRLNQASVVVSTYPYTDADPSIYLVHATYLDVAFQMTILAYSVPGDDRLRIDVFGESGQPGMIQVEDLTMKPLTPATKADDSHLFSYTKWDFASPHGASIVRGIHPSAAEVELADICETISYYYLCKWKSEITDAE
ncbi:MAG: hypothetical protein Q9181_003568 [Wetmoreana brouardii]